MDRARRMLYPVGELDYAVSPGETLREFLEEKEMTRYELAAQIGVPLDHADQPIERRKVFRVRQE